MNIEQRIQNLKIELATLNTNHEAMVAAKNQADQEFQQSVLRNQARFQQLTGAIAELELMLREKVETNGEPAPVNRAKRVKLNR